MEKQRFDNVLEIIGFGKWTILMFLSHISWGFILPYFSVGGAFYNPSVEHRCSLSYQTPINWTIEEKLNFSIPWEDVSGTKARSRCYSYHYSDEELSEASLNRYTFSDDAPKIKCHSWEYNNETFSSTVSTEWDLVCDKAGLSPFFQSFYFFGIAVGEPIVGFLSDRYGRRHILRVCFVLFPIVSLTLSSVPYYSAILAGRFLMGMMHASTGVSYVLAMEACPPKRRTIAGLFLNVPFAIGGALFGLLAYFIRNWRLLHYVCTIPSFIPLFLIPFIDESPRWLILKGRKKEAISTLSKATKWHKISMSDAAIETILCSQEREMELSKQICLLRHPDGKSAFFTMDNLQQSVKSFFMLFQTPVLRRITLAMFGCWFSCGVTYWGLALSGTTFSNNPFLYMVLSSLMDLFGYVYILPFVSKYGRKRIVAINFIVSSFAILTISITPSDYIWTIFSLALIGKMFILSCYNMLYFYSSELFPTSVRSRGLNLSSMMARLGSILSPFILETLAISYSFAPSIAFGGCALFGALMALMLPETKNKPLSETVEQTESLYGKNPLITAPA